MVGSLLPRLAATGFAVSFLLLAVPLGLASAGATPSAGRSPVPGVASARYTNFAGWAVQSSSTKAVGDVKGSWIVAPLAASCAHSAYNTAMWQVVAVDGLSAWGIAEIGTVAECFTSSSPARQYGAFYVIGTGAAVAINMTILPKDYVFGEVKFASNHFTFTLKDLNTSKTFTHAFSVFQSSGAFRDVAWWGVGGSTNSQSLAPFGQAKFGWNYTHVRSTNWANISGTGHNLGRCPGLVKIYMYDSSGTILRASPSSIFAGASTFYVTWHHY